jgi:hypothetical protein
MKRKPILAGKSRLRTGQRQVNGGYVDLCGEQFYKIANYDQMPPFFMSIVSDSDHWMFISSKGGLTAGRKNPDNALFPYYTDDRIHESGDHTGSKTIIFVAKAGKEYMWEPFSQAYDGIYQIDRNLYKNVYGNKLIFEEVNQDLCVVFRYGWFNSEKFGFIKHSQIINRGPRSVAVRVLDGIQNLLPAGVGKRFQLEYSTLVDAYKKNELQPETGLGIFMLSSIPVDKAEPSEALKATTVWSVGLKNSKRLVSSRQLSAFRKGLPVKQETDVRAAPGAYFVNAGFTLVKSAEQEWYTVADINQDASDVVALTELLCKNRGIKKELIDDIANGTDNLVRIVASADGLQTTQDTLSSSRHFSNVMFNVMRGGYFADNYVVAREDFVSFIGATNKQVLEKHADFLNSLPETIQRCELLSRTAMCGSVDLEKLCYEYMPLTFSRRHGDPSRPWNDFSIDIKGVHGERVFNYQGNWRDIFQNWEALALSFPGYVECMITKFVNASTADGYNPYRLTRDGFDWEVLDPHDPWSYIGYWGDHQVIYLAKLLEISARYHPGKLQEFLIGDMFSYANVPYRIKPYCELLKDPRNTIDFDMNLQREIETRVQLLGTDGKFVLGHEGQIVHVNLTEKLLVSILAKLSNFIPEAGIWMNTQRPDWNDANNALVGSGVSMVTLYYLRRHISFCRELLHSSGFLNVEISEEVAELLASVAEIFGSSISLLNGPVSDRNRRTIMDRLGEDGSNYRNNLYAHGLSERRKRVAITEVIEFFELSLKHIDHTIGTNKRKDHLFHAYNLMKVENGGEISIRHLYEMLEGQVAVLSSGYCSVGESLGLLDALRKSALYRKDQKSYILYPNRQLARFVQRNNIPKEEFEKSNLLQRLVEKGNEQIVTRDIKGAVHFNGDFRNANVLRTALDALKESEYQPLLQEERQVVLDIYERMFDHQSFTGRSGTFYKYEGLGSIYWHMISKLLLAVQEAVVHAEQSGEEESTIRRLMRHYKEIREGVGSHKPPELYGAFPTDPYSHTPEHAGVQQPGMTGQVKEDIISRIRELGVVVEQGTLTFKPDLLRRDEFLKKPRSFHYIDLERTERTIELTKGTLAFTFCQVPVLYHLSSESKIRVSRNDGGNVEIQGLSIAQKLSSSVFDRNGEIARIDVFLNPG